MPLTETTVVKDEHDHVIETSERKLYTLAELKDGKHIEDEPSNIIESRISGAYQRALEWLAEGTADWWEASNDEEVLVYLFEKAGITFDFKKAAWNVGYGGRWFALPSGTDVDVPVFLRAMKDFYAGIDYRHDGISPESYLICPKFSQHKIDLRSKDARIAKEQGLVVYTHTSYSRSTDEFDLDYHYDDMTSEFKHDTNYFLLELTGEAAKFLEADYEYQSSEENLTYLAEANDYTFTKTGHRA